jgi:cation diffusion facilitator CzcD-associated flavoprotein CzcO
MQRFDAVIVGAGFGGIGAAIQLKRRGYDKIAILERETDLGGTWHVNRYPGGGRRYPVDHLLVLV